MVVITRLNEYGNHLKYMVFMFFDILKKQLLEIKEIALNRTFKTSEQQIGFKTIPTTN